MQQVYIECYQILEEIINRYAPNDGDKYDLLQDLILEVMEKNQKFIKKLYDKNELRYFLAKMVKNNICSKTSRYFYIYKRENHDNIDDYKNYKEII